MTYMIKDRILSTLKFFDLQGYPLTLLELEKFLIADIAGLKNNIDRDGEVLGSINLEQSPKVSIDQILKCLDIECLNEVENHLGFYYLKGRKNIVDLRLGNYFFGIKREKLIRKFIGGLRHLPFVRGVALGGSQAMGQQKNTSDVDILVITEPGFMWLCRTLVTGYFQITGKRRHGQHVTDRFCLNHYLGGPKALDKIKNLYSAMEYARLRPLVYAWGTADFKANNKDWMNIFFPNLKPNFRTDEAQSKIQKLLEKFLDSRFGNFLEKTLKFALLARIKQSKFIIVEDDELSFHPDSKQEKLLQDFLQVS
jgi:hypothetical protein